MMVAMNERKETFETVEDKQFIAEVYNAVVRVAKKHDRQAIDLCGAFDFVKYLLVSSSFEYAEED